MKKSRILPPSASAAASFLSSLALLVLIAGCGEKSTADLPPNVSEISVVTPREGKSPSFSWNGAEGKPVSFDEFRGKITLVNFWATWCAPCKKELPDLIELHRKYSDRGLRVIGISTDRTPNAAQLVGDFVKQHNIPYQIVISTEEIENAFGNVRMMPTTFLVDPGGNVVRSFVGIRTMAQFEEAIATYLP